MPNLRYEVFCRWRQIHSLIQTLNTLLLDPESATGTSNSTSPAYTFSSTSPTPLFLLRCVVAFGRWRGDFESHTFEATSRGNRFRRGLSSSPKPKTIRLPRNLSPRSLRHRAVRDRLRPVRRRFPCYRYPQGRLTANPNRYRTWGWAPEQSRDSVA